MAEFEFRLPDVGEGLEEGEVVAWLVAPGDTVTRDQPLVEVQTDKALVELPSPIAGQVLRLAFAPGDIVKVGQTLITLDPSSPTELPPRPGRNVAEPNGVVERGGSAETTPDPRPSLRPKAPPAVRKLALDRGIDLATITGTGPGGRILASDVEAVAGMPPTSPGDLRDRHAIPGHAGSPLVGPSSGSQPPANDSGVPEDPYTALENASSRPAGKTGAGPQLGAVAAGRHPLHGIRRVAAETMARSWAEIPHITAMDELDASALLGARQALADPESGRTLSLVAFLVAATARALRLHPLVNASLDVAGLTKTTAAPGTADAEGAPRPPGDSDGPGDAGGPRTFTVHPDVNIGLAVATPAGLIVPVIRHADQRTLRDLDAESTRLTAAARDQKVSVADLTGGTFTISNYGSLGGRFATPLIRPPEVAIMGFGAIRDRPLAVDGQVVARPTLPYCLSADHRLIDGDLATAFAESVAAFLIAPIRLFADH